MNYNRIILGGHLTRQPQISYLPSQTAVCNFGLAINDKYKTKDGQQHEEVCFVDCAAFGKVAENIQQYFGKGDAILVEGKLKQDTWEDKNTKAKRSKHKITVERFTFLPKVTADAGGASESSGQDDAPF